jgi:hypothetical protein
MDLTRSKNIKIITERVSNEKLASLFNLCDYCITCTRGEGVSLLHLEGAYFGKPTISHDGGVFRDVKKFIDVPMISVPSKEGSDRSYQTFHSSYTKYSMGSGGK